MKSQQFTIDERLESIVINLSESERFGLRQSLELRGCLDPIVVWKSQNVIWDGINRFRICTELNISFEVQYIEFDNWAQAAKERIRHHQNRRQLNKCNVIESFLDLFEGEFSAEARANQLDGARKGGLAKSGSDETNIGDEERKWVNFQIAELANTNSTYVSCIRNIRKMAAEGSSDAIKSLALLRTGDISISSVNRKHRNKPSNTSSNKGSKGKAKPNTLLGKYDADECGFEFAQEKMNYDNLKQQFDNDGQRDNLTDPDVLLKIVSPFCKDDKLHSLVPQLMFLMEISYRIGFIHGLKGDSEDTIRADFGNREFEMYRLLHQWKREQDAHLFEESFEAAVVENNNKTENTNEVEEN